MRHLVYKDSLKAPFYSKVKNLQRQNDDLHDKVLLELEVNPLNSYKP